jgi:polyphosphate kinase
MKPEFSIGDGVILDQIREKDRFIHVPYHSF